MLTSTNVPESLPDRRVSGDTWGEVARVVGVVAVWSLKAFWRVVVILVKVMMVITAGMLIAISGMFLASGRSRSGRSSGGSGWSDYC
jgi:hypothetical protein